MTGGARAGADDLQQGWFVMLWASNLNLGWGISEATFLIVHLYTSSFWLAHIICLGLRGHFGQAAASSLSLFTSFFGLGGDVGHIPPLPHPLSLAPYGAGPPPVTLCGKPLLQIVRK